MSDLNSIPPAKYWRETQDWSQFIGKTGVVIASTLVQVTLPELETHAPYSLTLVQFDNPILDRTRQIFIGTKGNNYKGGDRVVCVLRRFSSMGKGLIHYGIKVSPAKT